MINPQRRRPQQALLRGIPEALAVSRQQQPPAMAVPQGRVEAQQMRL